MKKFLALFTAILILIFAFNVFADTIVGFTPTTSADKFTVNADNSVTLTNNANTSAYFDIDPGTEDFTVEVTLTPPSIGNGSYAVFGVASTTSGGFASGLWLKLRLLTATEGQLVPIVGLTDVSTAKSFKTGVNNAMLGISMSGNTVKIVKTGNSYDFFVNGILAYEDIVPVNAVGSRIAIGGNFLVGTACSATFSDFKYTDSDGITTTYMAEASSEATSSETTSSEATSSETTSSEATSSETTSSETTSSETTSSETTSSEATSSETISSEATSSETISSEATSSEDNSPPTIEELGFTPVSGLEDKIIVNDDYSLTFTHANNIYAYFNTNPGTDNYSFEVTVTPPPPNSYAVVGIGCPDSGGPFAGLWLKFRADLIGLYDNTDPASPHRAVPLMSGVAAADLNIVSGSNIIKIVKTNGTFDIYVNGILAYDDIAPTNNAGNKIAIGGNFNTLLSTTFKNFKYTDKNGNTTVYLKKATIDNESSPNTADNIAMAFVLLTLSVSIAMVISLKKYKNN